MVEFGKNHGPRDEEDSGEIKVTDRRLFTRDGQLREAIADEEESSDRATGQPTTEGALEGAERRPTPESSTGFERRPLDEPEGVDFTMLINAMAQPALIFLGEIPHPATGHPEMNLEQARLQIDLLDLLRIKCRGNLSADEDTLLDRMLYQLRMVFVARSSEPPPRPPGGGPTS